ncbi:MAG TPA: hypothetical protein PLD55_06520 [bacterium]|jgi:hypothetical protein|nr:hypothetical protein [bacterium]MDX9805050.1 hypothetical protein [bacterium]HOB70603.1 hypothetical protein [bacterium]HOG42819.1 hypothetical protein [bacterium]HPG35942.1 hypothetical protein [bacterium]
MKQEELSFLFPNSQKEPFTETSPATNSYNCIAWAANDNSKWYWPENHCYWPEGVEKKETIDSFIKMFSTFGYEICSDGLCEEGIEKIVIFSDENGKPTHAARQIDENFWTSKLGREIDVSHTLNAMCNGDYGNPAVFMKRRKKQSKEY